VFDLAVGIGMGFAHEFVADQTDTNRFAHLITSLLLVGKSRNFDAIAKRVGGEKPWPPRNGYGIATGITSAD
jgi:hypothetical protein